MGWSWRALVVLVWLGVSAAAVAETATVYLRDGDRLTGRIIAEDENELRLETRVFGEITIPVGEIERREPVLVEAPEAAVGVEPEREEVERVEEGAPETAAAVAAQAAVEPEPPFYLRILDGWRGDVQLGANLAFSTRTRQTFTGRLKGTHIRGPMKNILEYDATYGRTDRVQSDNRMDGSWKLEYDLGERRRFLVYNSAGAGFDRVRDIRLRYDIGPGVGYKWIMRPTVELKTEWGGNYQEQLFEGSERRRRYSIRLSEQVWWQITPKVRFEEKVEFFPDIDDFGEFRVRAELTLRYLLRENLTLSLNVINLYDTDVPANVSRNDLQIRSLLGIKF